MNRRLAILAGLSLASLSAYACSEAADGAPIASTPSSSSTSTTAPAPAAPPGTPPPPAQVPTGDAAAAGGAVINEIHPSAEWVELVNGGTTAVDLSGFYVADQEKDGGVPKTADAVKLPSGTILSPNAYLIVQGGSPDAGCPDGGQSYCLRAKFGISNKSGETIYLLDDKEQVIQSVVYPAEAVPKGSSYGRIPNGDPNGTFQTTVATPGEPNRTN